MLIVGTWNILASGLEDDDFVTKYPVKWQDRRVKIVDIMINMFSNGCKVIVTQENDHFFWILHKLRKYNRKITGVFCPKIKNYTDVRSINTPECFSTCRKQQCKKISDKNYPSFREEYAEDIANIFGINRSPDDPYMCDDGVGVYCVGDFHIDSSDLHLLVKSDRYMYSVFVNNNLPGIISGYYSRYKIVGAHLPSGRSEDRAEDRLKYLKYIFNKKPDIVLMDSNSGDSYPLNRSMLELIKENSYKDAVNNRYFETVKLRGYESDQEDKRGVFSFDTIDKILYSRRLICKKRSNRFKDLYGREYYRFKLYDRKFYRKFSKHHIDITDINILKELYPNIFSPSDHPPLMADFTLKKQFL